MTELDHRDFIDALANEGSQSIKQLHEALAMMVVAVHNAMRVNTFLQHQVDAFNETPRAKGALIIAQVCSEFGFSVCQMRGPGRYGKISAARREACVRLAAAGFSRTDSGRLLNMDRSSVTQTLRRASGGQSPSKRPPRKDLWSEAESNVARRLARREITTDQAQALLKNRSREAITRRAWGYKGPRT